MATKWQDFFEKNFPNFYFPGNQLFEELLERILIQEDILIIRSIVEGSLEDSIKKKRIVLQILNVMSGCRHML